MIGSVNQPLPEVSGAESESMVKRAFAAVALVVSLAGGGLMLAAEPASAGAYGCNGWTTTWAGYTVPSGAYCATISGQGRYVQAVSGSFGATNLCNTRITAEFFDSAWRWTGITYNAGTWGGCGKYRNQTIWLDRYVPSGFMCSTLYSNNVRLTSVCHRIG
jgi:hypothetical protein